MSGTPHEIAAIEATLKATTELWKHGSTDGEVWADVGLTLPVIRFLLDQVESLTRARDEAQQRVERMDKEWVEAHVQLTGRFENGWIQAHPDGQFETELGRQVAALIQKVAIREARLAVLEAALKKYGKHNVGCNARKWPIGSLAEQDAKCSCGFTEVGAALASHTET